MKFTLFHLMPYADLDLDAAAAYPTAWVLTPNHLYDPKKGAKLYNRYLDELELGEALSFLAERAGTLELASEPAYASPIGVYGIDSMKIRITPA
jgi:hypothetical protein